MCELYGDIMPVRKVGPDAHLVHALGLPDPLVGHRRGDARHGRAAGAGPRRASSGWSTPGWSSWTSSWPRICSVAGLRQHAYRLRRLRLHAGLPGSRLSIPQHVKPHNMWGCSNAQIFSEVSPKFHWEFALEHDLRWLSRWGLNYYGCCEPLDGKADLLQADS